MKRRLVIGGAVLAAVAVAVPVASASSRSSATVPVACVVVNGPSGLHLQVGYAPHGPGDCTQLPPA